ncbi:AbrB/MazE/SpoVT family DNA-binding domain-containing protein [Geobacillus kaustophilus]|uniref:AbrB/MazE/SpoVT family DNA-binding domain-containing protein n=1 Tax=Geobacillus kaustophilus TaxID=1462 RepID=UPI000AA9FC01|nr:AbrB/MazE/SpoVT family DNA-binding domain-containing protein [Geobacillus kaustophilus]
MIPSDAMTKEKVSMDKLPNDKKKRVKRIAVSSKKQITIPKDFYEQLGIGNEVLIELADNKLIIHPIHEDHFDFSDLILKDLIREGYTGEELYREFVCRKSQIAPALDAMIAEERPKAKTYTSDTLEELFGEEDEQ